MLALEQSDFLGDPDQYCEETLYFCDYSGGQGPDPMPPPLDPRMLFAKVCIWESLVYLGLKNRFYAS